MKIFSIHKEGEAGPPARGALKEWPKLGRPLVWYTPVDEEVGFTRTSPIQRIVPLGHGKLRVRTMNSVYILEPAPE